MSVKWVMSEKKIVRVRRPVPGQHHPVMVEYVDKAFDVGDPAPEGHEGRPYTRQITVKDGAEGHEDGNPGPAADERQEPPAQDRMDRGKGARNRKR